MPRHAFTVKVDHPEMSQAYEFTMDAPTVGFAEASGAILALACEEAKRHPNGVGAAFALGVTGFEEDELRDARLYTIAAER